MTRPDYARRAADDPCPDFASNAEGSTGSDGPETPPSIRVVETVADVLETEPTELGPLYEAIDPDALDQLFASPRRFTSGCVAFTFEGCVVTVDADGPVTVSPEADDVA